MGAVDLAAREQASPKDDSVAPKSSDVLYIPVSPELEVIEVIIPRFKIAVQTSWRGIRRYTDHQRLQIEEDPQNQASNSLSTGRNTVAAGYTLIGTSHSTVSNLVSSQCSSPGNSVFEPPRKGDENMDVQDAGGGGDDAVSDVVRNANGTSDVRALKESLHSPFLPSLIK
jgi:hypothetical protein